MANPRQRRKARSSSHKPVSHSLRAKKMLKKTPPIRGPKVLQDAWDKHKTVRQNYTKLGLVHRLDPLASGGVEPTEERESTPVPAGIPAGHGKIMRDEAGNVVGIEIVEAESEMKDGMSRWTEVGGPKSNAALDLVSDTSPSAGPRRSSALELNYLERLVKKYGLDLEKMARDTKLNDEQRTVGELRRGFKRAGLLSRG